MPRFALYKKALRELQSYNPERYNWRYYAVLLRAEFDKHVDIKDARVAKVLLEKGEEELEAKQHAQPLKFPSAPGGAAYNRVAYHPDWLLDSWHPIEKSAYPHYFAKRDQRKAEYIERWEKKYGKPEPSAH